MQSGGKSVSEVGGVALGTIENAIRVSSGMHSERELNLFSQLKINMLQKNHEE